jgi:UDP-glucuronate 4-epimerase
MSRHYLVTGGAGFIGSNLVDRLLSSGHTVTVLDNFDPFYSRARKEANLERATRSPCFQFIEGAITDPGSVGHAFERAWPDVVVHLAAKAGVRPSIEDPIGYNHVNVEGTLQLLEKVKERPATRFIFASSSSVYGDRPDAPFRETDRVDDPISPYAATKKAGELLCHTYHHLYGLPVTCLRFFTAYGPRNRPDLAIAKFMRLIDRGEPIPVFGDGTTRRDYTFIDDIVDGVVRAADRCKEYAIYNLGNAAPVELSRLVELIAQALGKTPRIERLPPQPGDVRQTCADITLAQRELGYAPATKLSDGLRRYVEWYRNEGKE